jgi:hypothetical protein
MVEVAGQSAAGTWSAACVCGQCEETLERVKYLRWRRFSDLSPGSLSITPCCTAPAAEASRNCRAAAEAGPRPNRVGFAAAAAAAERLGMPMAV